MTTIASLTNNQMQLQHVRERQARQATRAAASPPAEPPRDDDDDGAYEPDALDLVAEAAAHAAPPSPPDPLAPLRDAHRRAAAGAVAAAAVLADAEASFGRSASDVAWSAVQTAVAASARATLLEQRTKADLDSATAAKAAAAVAADEARFAELLHSISSAGMRERVAPYQDQLLALLDALALSVPNISALVADANEKRLELRALAEKLGHHRTRGDQSDGKPGHTHDLTNIIYLNFEQMLMVELGRIVRDHCQARGIDPFNARFLKPAPSDSELEFSSAIRR